MDCGFVYLGVVTEASFDVLNVASVGIALEIHSDKSYAILALDRLDPDKVGLVCPLLSAVKVATIETEVIHADQVIGPVDEEISIQGDGDWSEESSGEGAEAIDGAAHPLLPLYAPVEDEEHAEVAHTYFRPRLFVLFVHVLPKQIFGDWFEVVA